MEADIHTLHTLDNASSSGTPGLACMTSASFLPLSFLVLSSVNSLIKVLKRPEAHGTSAEASVLAVSQQAPRSGETALHAACVAPVVAVDNVAVDEHLQERAEYAA
jgi:hypothetical protein